jgi:hypothetical protein
VGLVDPNNRYQQASTEALNDNFNKPIAIRRALMKLSARE